jgi:2-phospho-L-lactate/phosphoenolpyruvate guanylyltransferase
MSLSLSSSDGVTIWLPVKGLRAAKLRLTSLLSPDERRSLALAMLHDVARASADAGFVPNVLSPDPDVLAWAEGIGARGVRQPRDVHSLNGALAWALQSGQAGAALIILSDTPLATAAEITEIARPLRGHGDEPCVSLVPDRRGLGTNAMLLRPPSLIPVRYGRDSFQRHLRAARNAQAAVHVHELGGLGFDIDVPEDVRDFLEIGSDTHARRLLVEWGVAARIERAII